MAHSSSGAFVNEMEGIPKTCVPNESGKLEEDGLKKVPDGETQVLVEKEPEGQGDTGSEEISWNPLEVDHALDFGLLHVIDVVGKYLFKEGRAKDVPCQFHNGFSRTCWKGSNCPYSHELYTGGYFAKLRPDTAMAASAREERTCVTRLPHKPILGREAQIFCRVTHIISPSEFFIVPSIGTDCICRHVENKFRKHKEAEGSNEKIQTNDQLEAYEYGFNCVEIPSIISHESTDAAKALDLKSIGLVSKLQHFLQNGLRYRNYQTNVYFPNSELAAVRIDGKWMRAVVLIYMGEVDKTKHGAQLVRFQLLDTGEKVTLDVKDACRLPEMFSIAPPAAFRCCLFGISPVWASWTKAAIKMFKELVENNEILLIVKESIPTDRPLTVFEPRPYVVKMLVKINDVYTDVAHKLLEKGYGLQWNPFPFRPFAKEVIDPKVLEPVYEPVRKPLPLHALDLENKRLEWTPQAFQLREEGDCLSSSMSSE